MRYRVWYTMGMRTIKFRAWDVVERVMRYGLEMEDVKWSLGYCLQEPDSYHVMQFTGLLDKNGKEIYEGDVVVKPYVDPLGGLHTETEDGRFKVGFEHGQFVLYRTEPQPLVGWCEKEKGEYVSNYGNLTIVKDKTVLEVIGNIYENPELI